MLTHNRLKPPYGLCNTQIRFGIGSALGLVTFIAWIVLMVAAWRGRYFKLPLFGDNAEQYSNRLRK